MIKGISYWSLENGLAGTHPLEQALEDARTADFECLELCIAIEGVLTPYTSRRECEAVRRLIDRSNLVVETLASGMSWNFNPTSNNSEVRARSVELHSAAIERAAWLGCQAILFVPGIVKSPIAPTELIRNDHALERARTVVAQLLDTAETHDVDVCLENVWNGLFSSPLELREFVDRFDSEHLGVYFDVGNVLRYHQHPPHWVEILGRRIKRVHVKDFAEEFGWNGNYTFCELGGGDVPWQATVEALHEIGYDSTVVAEILPHSPGILEQTSAALDAIMTFARPRSSDHHVRVDKDAETGDKPHLRAMRPGGNLNKGK